MKTIRLLVSNNKNNNQKRPSKLMLGRFVVDLDTLISYLP